MDYGVEYIIRPFTQEQMENLKKKSKSVTNDQPAASWSSRCLNLALEQRDTYFMCSASSPSSSFIPTIPPIIIIFTLLALPIYLLLKLLLLVLFFIFSCCCYCYMYYCFPSFFFFALLIILLLTSSPHLLNDHKHDAPTSSQNFAQNFNQPLAFAQHCLSRPNKSTRGY